MRRIFGSRAAAIVSLSRRPFAFPIRKRSIPARLASVAAAMAVALLAGTAKTQNAVANGDTRTISLIHEHTKESATITFKRDGRYDRAALDQLNWLLRDWREGEATKMDPRLFDVVWEAQRSIGSSAPLRIVCGYRSPKTNGMLRRRSAGVAEHSQHTLGKAMDFFMTDASIDDIRAAGIRLQRGGVGWYPRSGSPFVHLDVGSVRAWPRLSRDQLARIFPDGKTVHLPADGKPLARYEEARAEILARGGTVLGYTGVAQSDEIDDGPGLKGFFASLFGSGSTSATAPVPEATPGKARGKASIVVANADPDDATGAKQALAFAAPTSTEALRDAMIRREGRDPQFAKALLTGETAPASVAAPLPPRRPTEFAAVADALHMPPPTAHRIDVASLGNAGLSGVAAPITTQLAPPSEASGLVPATAKPADQLRDWFRPSSSGASQPASATAPVRVALVRAGADEAPAGLVSSPGGEFLSRFSTRSPGDDLAASRFAGSATATVAAPR